jgi:hypothetical protein
MKVWKPSICIGSILLLVLSCGAASATSITDGSGDVWHYAQTGTSWSYVGNVGNKGNIDIKEVAYTVNNNKLTLSLEVYGTIQNSEKITYIVFYNSTDSQYFFSYTNGEGGGIGWKGMNFTSGQNVTVNEDMVSVELDVLGDTSKVELWGYAVEYTTLDDYTKEWWGDWAPNEKLPFQTGTDGDNTNGTDGNQGGDNTSGGSKTPGFEVIPVLAAVAVALILLRKRR